MGKKVFDKRTIWCPFPDCFSCPHPDCIKTTIPRPMPKEGASTQGKAAKEKTEVRLDREREAETHAEK